MGRMINKDRAVGAMLLTFSGCIRSIDQSAMHPAGPAAAEITWLTWIMLVAFALVFLLMLLLFWRAFALRNKNTPPIDHPSRRPGAPPPLGNTGFIVAGGIAFPLLVVTPLFVISLETSYRLRQPSDAWTIEVTGRMWWWEVRYPDQDIVTANEIHIPVGRPVRLELTSTDVIHSLWIPRLNGKRDMIPGQRTSLWIQADQPGVYRGQCAEYCGTQHARMALEVVAMAPDEFERWVEARHAPRPPLNDEQVRGRRLFQTVGCIQCHRVSDLAGGGNAGPDLTHMGSRRTIGAALLPNHRGNLAGWIANPQALKPGIKMPRTFLPSEDLMALVAYLESLP